VTKQFSQTSKEAQEMLALIKSEGKSIAQRKGSLKQWQAKSKLLSRKKRKSQLNRQQVKTIIETMRASDQLLLPKVFGPEMIREILDSIPSDVRKRDRFYTPEVAISLFVQQMLMEHCGCLKMVHVFNRIRMKRGQVEVSIDSSSYCSARMRLPLKLFETLHERTVDLVKPSRLDPRWLWKSRRVVLVDGMVVHAPDTPENQAVYPQPSSQLPGLGFPQLRLTVAICLASGVVLNSQNGPVEGKKTGEVTQFRAMQQSFLRGDIVVTDSNFECYRDLASLKYRGIDMVSCINGTRSSPFKGSCVAIEDKYEQIAKPKFDSTRFTREEWEALPAFITVRIIRYPVDGRNESITIVTTLLDREEYSAQDVADLYGYRWSCELDIRSIKTIMGMNELACLTPEMLQRELMTYFLAYNLVRVTMVDAARVTKQKPNRLAFKSAKNAWLAFDDASTEDESYSWLLWSVAQQTIGHRPGRQEPRKIKRRNSKYERLKLPRAVEKAALAA
jgi:hypothetical protein